MRLSASPGSWRRSSGLVVCGANLKFEKAQNSDPSQPSAVHQAASGGGLSHEKPVRGRRPGDVYVRIRREDLGRAFKRGAHGHLVATEETERATGPVGLALSRWRNFLLGRPLDSEALGSERLPIFKALPILSSDALSSVAYGPEAGLAVLAAAGASAFIWNVPIAIAPAPRGCSR